MDKLLIIIAVCAVILVVATVAICNDAIIGLQKRIGVQMEVIQTLQNQVNSLRRQIYEQDQHESPEDRTNFDA